MMLWTLSEVCFTSELGFSQYAELTGFAFLLLKDVLRCHRLSTLWEPFHFQQEWMALLRCIKLLIKLGDSTVNEEN